MATDDNLNNDIDFDLKKKKKKSKNRLHQDVLPETTVPTDLGETTDDADFSYEYLISRAFDTIRKNNPELSQNQQVKIILPAPQLARIGTKRISFQNFRATCQALKRQEKLLLDYFVAELGTTASIDGNHALIIRGRLSQRQIETVLRSFIKEYVSCKTCHSPDTLLKKEDRLTVIQCDSCHSKYTVSNIRSGFQAQVGRRSTGT